MLPPVEGSNPNPSRGESLSIGRIGESSLGEVLVEAETRQQFDDVLANFVCYLRLKIEFKVVGTGTFDFFASS